MVQDAVDRWWCPSLMMFGLPDSGPNSEQSMRWGTEQISNDDLRGSSSTRRRAVEDPRRDHARPDLRWNEERQRYDFGAIDWKEFWQVVGGDGPCISGAPGGTGQGQTRRSPRRWPWRMPPGAN
jgi:ring-1,2-phenylacetyl-CoA epoxidase subunit PaaA